MRLIQTRTLYNHTLYINPEDEIGREIIRKGIYDRSCLEVLKSILDKIEAPVIFDIGANIGNHAISISTDCKRIYAFEPDAGIMSILMKNIHANRINNIVANEMGLSDSTRHSDFYVNMDGNIGASTLDPDARGRKFKRTRVSLTTGDSYVKDNAIDRIDLLKIDVEGHEIQVLSGFEKTLDKYKPIILMEWSAAKTISESKNSRLFENISQNYKAFVATSSRNKSLWKAGLSAKIKRFLHKLLFKETWYLHPADLTVPHANVFLVHPDKLALINDLIYAER